MGDPSGSSTLELFLRWSHTCLSSSPVLPGLFQLFRQDSDFDLSREEGGRPCFVDFLPSLVTVSGVFTTAGSPDKLSNSSRVIFSLLISRWNFSLHVFGGFWWFIFSCTVSSYSVPFCSLENCVCIAEKRAVRVCCWCHDWVWLAGSLSLQFKIFRMAAGSDYHDALNSASSLMKTLFPEYPWHFRF